jgi:hypothetical protein
VPAKYFRSWEQFASDAACEFGELVVQEGGEP